MPLQVPRGRCAASTCDQFSHSFQSLGAVRLNGAGAADDDDAEVEVAAGARPIGAAGVPTGGAGRLVRALINLILISLS